MPHFFYPPAIPRRLATRDGRHIDTAEAAITLAEIPVVRLRHGLPHALQEGRSRYNETVAALQEALDPPHLEINLAARAVRCGSRAVTLKPAVFAWLVWWVRQAIAGQPLKEWREADAGEYLAIYERIVGMDSAALEHAQKRLAHGMEEDFFQQNNSRLEAAIKTALGPAAAPYLLARQGKKPHTRRGLSLPKEAIRVIG
ncbi:MAG: hypothetical protein HZC43_03265 [Nitrosomonadales bacterium]|nr:hypothetical protein [Nitrosomonadales bacterium]